MAHAPVRWWIRRWHGGLWLVSAAVVVAAGPPTIAAEEAPVSAAAGELPGAATVQDNMGVGLEYTLTVEGDVVESTEGREPLRYIHGRSQIIPGLERQLAGLHIGETAEVSVNPEEGYGLVDPEAFIEVPRTQLPADVTPEVGMVLRGINPDGQNFQARVDELKEESAVLNLNHPLAGKTLNFKVKILDLSPAPAPRDADEPLQVPAQRAP